MVDRLGILDVMGWVVGYVFWLVCFRGVLCHVWSFSGEGMVGIFVIGGCPRAPDFCVVGGCRYGE